MTLSRRMLIRRASAALALSTVAPALGSIAPSATFAQSVDGHALAVLVRSGIERDAEGQLRSVFGLDTDVAPDVLLPATRATALPDGYAPSDLVSAAQSRLPSAGVQQIRELIVDDTRALLGAADADGADLYIGSGYRSESYQVGVFAAQIARWGDADTANRYSARPGHSQHQLGTTIDFTNVFRGFRDSPSAEWLRDRAHEFGFVLPYTDSSQPLTGYVPEPWHARWVGRPLAQALQGAGYQTWDGVCADDVLAAVLAKAEAGRAD